MSIFTVAGKKVVLMLAVIALVAITAIALFHIAYAGHVLPNIHIGSVDVGGLPVSVAEAKLEGRIQSFSAVGIPVTLDGQTQLVHLDRFGIRVDATAAVEQAAAVGRTGNFANQIKELYQVLSRPVVISSPLVTDEAALSNEIAGIAALYDQPGRDIRFVIKGTEVQILNDTKPGFVIDQQRLRNDLLNAAATLDFSAIAAQKILRQPHVDPQSVVDAVASVKRVIATPLTLIYQGSHYEVTPKELAGFLASSSEGNRLVVSFDTRAIAQYVASIAERVNTSAQSLQVIIKDNLVTSFTAPRAGRVLEEADTISLLRQALTSRLAGKEAVSELSLPVAVRQPVVDGSAADLGIKELIGSATTTFAGSPKNRIANIKNGTRFLTGILIAPDNEFSTIGALGEIDNTTGYLPELVIKGDRTVPEFGGGLCQVSTTLFRSVLNAGLPVTTRQNHSYRVSYYEKDAKGKYIGPGLDATIYSPRPDFRFKNDTGKNILIVGHVEGDLITFDLYGTKDGRRAVVDGPHTLSTIPAGSPIYVESDTIASTSKQLLEHAHAGGSAIATYTITYNDGHVETQEFKSYYRPWPERWLVGSDTPEAKQLNAESPAVSDNNTLSSEEL